MEDPPISTKSIRMRLRTALVAVVLVASLLPVAAATAADPLSVTVAGSLQTEAGCAADWEPACAATHLAYDANDDVWQGTFSLPAASYEYKAALNDSWDENYGLHAEFNSPNNVPLRSRPAGPVKFYYDHKSHWVTDNHGSVIAVAAGSFQGELGCAADWDPTCLRSWLQDVDGDGTYSFETTALPQGSYETKVAISEDWAENYGPNGELNSPNNIGFAVPADNARVTMGYDSVTHVLSITVAADHGAPGGPGALSHFDLARKDCLGTARNRTSKVWYTVAGGILSDVYYPTVDNTNVETLQYIVTDGSTFTDLQARDMTFTVAAIADTGGMACRVTASANRGTYQIVTDYITDPARNTLLMHVTFESETHGLQLLRSLRPDGQRQRRRRHRQRRRRLGDGGGLDRPSDPRRVGSGHGHERGQS